MNLSKASHLRIFASFLFTFVGMGVIGGCAETPSAMKDTGNVKVSFLIPKLKRLLQNPKKREKIKLQNK